MSSSPSSALSDVAIKNRFLGFLIWQSISSTIIFLVSRAFISSIANNAVDLTETNVTSFGRNPFLALVPSFIGFISFFSFHISQLLFSAALSLVTSPQHDRPATLLELAIGFLRLLFVSGIGEDARNGNLTDGQTLGFRDGAKVSLRFVLFVSACATSSLIAVGSLCSVGGLGFDDGFLLIGRVAFRGFTVGSFYGLYFIYKRRWVLEFPIVQRPPYFSFKMGLPSATTRASKLSGMAYLISTFLVILLPHLLKAQLGIGRFLAEQMIFGIAIFCVFLCWELTHQLHQVLHTKRFIFAPPKGSAAAETNPSEHLLLALETSHPCSLLRYLAYLDLCMVSENNVDTWRRAAFFEETGETYKRVMAVCLKPLENLASAMGESLSSVDKATQLSNQLLSHVDSKLDAKYSEQLNNFQLCAWCARTVASLTAHSHNEDKFGVAQLSGSNAAVISTLISCLLAVETFMGKKTTMQSPSHLMGPAGFRIKTGKTDFVAVKRRNGVLHLKAYAIADILRTSIYQVVSAFNHEMLASTKAGLLERDWLINGKPLFGTREVLLVKLKLFLDYRAT